MVNDIVSAFTPFRLIAETMNVDCETLNAMTQDTSVVVGVLAAGRDFPESNNLEHSARVLQNCSALIGVGDRRYTPADRRVLLYAALLHDISKVGNADVKADLARVIGKAQPLFAHEKADHGVRSAYYIRHLREEGTGKHEFPGLDDQDVAALLNVVSFHSSCVRIPSLSSEPVDTGRVLALSLLFRLADVADCSYRRVAAASLVDDKRKHSKTKARSHFEGTRIERDRIVWVADRKSPAATTAVDMENVGLARHATLLSLMGLPSVIVCEENCAGGRKGSPTKPKVVPLPQESLETVGLYQSAKERVTPLVLVDATFDHLYEKIVAAFCDPRSPGRPSGADYVGPVVLQVADVEDDDFDKTLIRSVFPEITVKSVRSFTKAWLSPSRDASSQFYFGYTHGQRICSYRYPSKPGELEPTRKAADWTGLVDQLNGVAAILQGRKDARDGYVIVPHPIVDSSTSRFHEAGKRPSLLAVHFRIEENALSGFAFMRSQEMSLFSAVNYLEVKELLIRLQELLKRRYPHLSLGRVVMTSSLAYFDKATVLLAKPMLCRFAEADITAFGSSLHVSAKRDELLRHMEEFGTMAYERIETAWVESLIRSLGRRRPTVIMQAKKTRDLLLEIDKKLEDKKTTPHKSLKAKQNAMKPLIDLVAKAR